jgi:hypothetical protein
LGDAENWITVCVLSFMEKQHRETLDVPVLGASRDCISNVTEVEK